MDYEKKYKEALERAKKLHKEAITLQLEQDIKDYEYIFPELKEPEDEEIKKVLIDYFKTYKTQEEFGIKTFFGIPTNNIITWLEKQGSEPNWCHHKVDLSDCSEEYRKAYYDGWNNCNMQHSQCELEKSDVLKCLINGMKFYYEDNKEATWGTEKFSMKVKDILSWLEKQDSKNIHLMELKAKAYDDAKERMSYAYNQNRVPIGFISEIFPNLSLYENQGESKFEQCIQEGDKIVTNEDGTHFNVSQFERVTKKESQVYETENGEAKKNADAAWSEEDYSKVQRICKYLNEAKKYYADITEVRDCVDWLNSLKDRVKPQWKPSEEQIQALEYQVHSTYKGSWQYMASKELLEQLKKL